jgi:hypothetical protein
VDGLKAAGPDFDRQKVIDAINAMTDWTGDGIAPPIDWTRRHTDYDDTGLLCQAYVTITDSAFEANFSKKGKPFLCVDFTDPSAGLKAVYK